MNKKLIALAVAGAFAVPMGAQAASADVSGFVDIIYTADDEASDPAKGTYLADGKTKQENMANSRFNADAEIDVVSTFDSGVTVRVDVDLNIAGNSGTTLNGTDSARIEQAFFAWAATEGITVIGGVFNNPIGAEAEDAPDLDFTTHGAVYGVLNQQTALNGNNIAGVAVAGAAGPVTITGAFLNDIGQSAAAAEKNSVALVVNYSPIAGLDLELGYVTQEDYDATNNAFSAGDVLDFNAVWNGGPVTVGLDYLSPSDVVDSAYTAWVKVDVGSSGVAVGLRRDEVSWDTAVLGSGVNDTNATTLYASYQAAENLLVALEIKDTNDGDQENGAAIAGVKKAVSGLDFGSDVTLEFIGTF